MPKEVEIFLNLQNELQINSLDEARSLIKSTRQERIDINKTKKETGRIIFARIFNELY